MQKVFADKIKYEFKVRRISWIIQVGPNVTKMEAKDQSPCRSCEDGSRGWSSAIAGMGHETRNVAASSF